MSLSRPHPVWSSAHSNPYEVNKAIIQARMLSGRYRTERLCRFWSSNPNGSCLLPSCSDANMSDDIRHILIECPSLSPARGRLISFCEKLADDHPILRKLIFQFLYTSSTPFQTQFLLDCSSLACVIELQQSYGFYVLDRLFYLSRTWCYSIHRDRLRLLERWKFL